MKITAQDLLKLRVIDTIIPEPLGGAQRDPVAAIASIESAIAKAFGELSGQGPDELRHARAEKFLAIGRKI
jgi:acetyl-CoA carboxylase carboxyl transferase subunit alpha